MGTHLSSGVLNVQKVGFAGNDHTLDLVSGFNKVTVKTSNYPINNAIPEEDIDELKILSITDVSEGEKCHTDGIKYLVNGI